ncbi:MAG: ATP-binding cassette domain-containing protein [Deltaproteobacteria bacterium]|nr:ATP-binding cassette domain-containing protein [Deltaproteobacteria bacterium]
MASKEEFRKYETGEPIVTVRNLSKSFGSLRVLKDLNCDIKAGETTVFLGPSGTGKSVFIKHIVGLLKPDEGELEVMGRNVPTLGERELYELRKHLGLAFQLGALFDSLNVYDNVSFPLSHHTRMRQKEIKSRVAEVLELVGLPGTENKLTTELSTGQQKRVGLARALALNPTIVLFDEPTTGLDPILCTTIDELILKLKTELGKTFIVISHDIEGTWNMADQVGVLYQGTLLRYGRNADVRRDDNIFLKQFFGRTEDGPMIGV